MRIGSVVRVVALVVAVVVAVALVGSSGGHTAVGDADKTFVVVLARHVRHEADLASRVRDPTAVDVAARAGSAADQLDALLRSWRVTSAEADARFASATADVPKVTTNVVYGCSLHGRIDDVGQIETAPADQATATWARLAMTGALEGLQLSATAGDHVGGEARRQGATSDALQRRILDAIAPLLPITDQRLARAGGQAL